MTASLLDAVAGAIGVAGPTGTSVHGHEERRGTGMVTLYPLGDHSALWCDPEVVDRVAAAVRSYVELPLTIADWAVIADSHGATPIGVGFEHVLPPNWQPPVIDVEQLDPRSTETVRLVTELLDRCSEDDRDEADFDPDHLDPILVGRVQDDELVAIAGGRPEPLRPGFHDIGVVVRPDRRHAGIGVEVVAGVAARILDAGEHPLYRCNLDNVGSRRLAERVGFVRVLEIAAFRWND